MMRRFLIILLVLALSPLPAAAQSVILSQYPPGRAGASSSLPIVLSTEDKAVLDAVAASLAALDNAIAGNEFQVDVLTLPNVTVSTFPDNEPFNVAQYGGSAVGAGNAFHVQPGTSAVFQVQSNSANLATQTTLASALTALQLIDDVIYVDDADFTVGSSSHALVGGVYQSSPTAVTDGDTAAFSLTSDRSLRVAITAGAGSGGTSATDDAAFTVASGTGTPAMFMFDDVSPDTINEGDVGVMRMSANRVGYFTIRDAAGNERGAGVNSSNELLVSCSGCSGTGASHIDDAAFSPGTDDGVGVFGMFDDVSPDSVNEGDGGIVRMSANRNLYVTLRDAAGNERGLNVDASGFLTANINGTVTVGSHAVTNAGTFAVQVDGNALTALQLIDDIVYTDEVTFTATTSKIAGIGAVFDDASSNTMDEDEIGSLRMTAARALHVQVQNTSIATTNGGTFVVQENGAALTALQLIDNIVSVEDAVAGSAWSGVGMLAVRQDSHADLAADGDFIPLTIDADGGLRVSIVAGAGSGGTAIADDADFTAGTTSGTPVIGFYQSSVTACTDGDACVAGITAQRAWKVTLYSEAGSALTPSTDYTHDAALTLGSTTGPVLMGSFDDTGTDSVDENDAGALRISANRNLYISVRDAAGNERGLNIDASGQLAATIAGSALTALQLIDDPVFADDAAFTIATSKVMMAGFTVDEASIDSADEGDAVAARTTADRVLWAAAGAVSATSQGWVTSYTAAGASTNATNVKNAAGNVYGFSVTNTTTTTYYLRMYNLSSSPTCSSSTGFVESIAIPAGSASIPSGRERWHVNPQAYGTGIGFCITGGAANNDNTNAATGVYVTVAYK
jgi:hypothetical protein